MKRNAGYSLIELLVATAILGIVLSLASQGIIMALRHHRSQQEVVAVQSKLRRINEAMSQEVRAAVLGGLANYPVVTSATGVSLMLLDGGSGYQVLSRTSSKIEFVADVASVTDLGFAQQVLLVDPNGNALIINHSSITALGSSVFRIDHPACSNTLTDTKDNLVFSVQAVGFDYDAGEKTLYREDLNSRLPVAFDLSDFRIDYVTQGGTTSRLNLLTEAEYRTTTGKTVQRQYSGQVDLAQADASFTRRIKEVKTCN